MSLSFNLWLNPNLHIHRLTDFEAHPGKYWYCVPDSFIVLMDCVVFALGLLMLCFKREFIIVLFWEVWSLFLVSYMWLDLI